VNPATPSKLFTSSAASGSASSRTSHRRTISLQELRANLISIGIWIIKESERIRKRESDNFQGIIDISIIIRDGLK
jgi:flagellar biosynthesis regulator FlaF